MPQMRLRAVFMRGGTSKALMFRRSDLPADRAAWDAIFLAALGSPDPNGRQLDGMGGGISSLSKICVIGLPSRSDADVDYSFAQVSVADARVDHAGNCGNMSAAVGPFAVDEGLVPRPAGGEAAVRIHNTNTGKIIVSRFPMDGDRAAVDGDLAIDGVAGAGAPVRLDFLDPGGAKTGRLLPTGNAVDQMALPDGGAIAVSLIDAGNPGIFVAADALGLAGAELPAELEADAALLDRLEAIRELGAVMMGLAPDRAVAAQSPAIPKVAILAPPAPSKTLSGRMLAAGEMDILARTLSMGRPHRAVPQTGALCLAAACRVPGTIAHAMMAARSGTAPNGPIRIAHPSGVTLVAAEAVDEEGAIRVPHATLYLTARRLFQGEVLYRDPTSTKR